LLGDVPAAGLAEAAEELEHSSFRPEKQFAKISTEALGIAELFKAHIFNDEGGSV
jgi:hypothetical protein